jgi:hypothetical protein
MEGRIALAPNLNGPNNLIQCVLANGTIVGHGLDVQKTPVGLKAHLPQSRQVLQ